MNKTLSVVTLLVLGALVGFLFWALKPSESMDYKVWPVTISELSKTEQLKVVSFHKEILVGQHRLRKGLFKDTEEKIYVVYPATINVGFDLSKCDNQSIVRLGEDSVLVTLPPVEILNKDGFSVDEASKHTAIENGVWEANDMNMLRKRAEAMMLRNCETDSCYRMAEQVGAKMVKAMINNLGYSHVEVKILPRTNYGLALSKKGQRGWASCKFYEREGERFLLATAPNGGKTSRLYYHNGQLTYQQLLALGDFFAQYSISHPGDMDVKIKSSQLNLIFRHDGVSSGSKEAVKVVKNAASRNEEALKRDISHRIFLDKYPMRILDVGKDGKVIHSSSLAN